MKTSNRPLLPLVTRLRSLGQPLADEPDLPAVVELILHDVEPLPVVVRLLAVPPVAPLVEPVVVADGQLLERMGADPLPAPCQPISSSTHAGTVTVAAPRRTSSKAEATSLFSRFISIVRAPAMAAVLTKPAAG